MSNSRRLVFCMDSPGFGGSEINMLKLIEALSDTNDISLITTIQPAKEVQDYINNKRLNQVRHHAANQFAKGVKGLYRSIKILKKQQGEIYIFWCHHLNSNRWLQLAAAFLRKKFIVVEQLLPTVYSKPDVTSSTWVFKKYIARRAFKTVICAYSQEGAYRRNFNTTNTLVIPNARNVKKIAGEVESLKRKNKKEGPFVITCVGRLAIQKNQKTLIDAFFRLSGKLPVKLMLVGDGENRYEIEKYIKEICAENVIITGFTKNIYGILAETDLFVLPSFDEGLPGALIEAMAAKIPCIASDIPGNNELIINAATGYLFPANDPLRLMDLMEFLLKNPSECLRIAEKAYQHVLKEYNESVEFTRWHELLEN